jgi:hypothetical protein
LGIPRCSQWVTCPLRPSYVQDLGHVSMDLTRSPLSLRGVHSPGGARPWMWGGGPRRWLCAHLLSEWHGGGDGSFFGSTPIWGRRELRYTWQCLVVIRQVWIMPRSPLGSGSGVFYRIPMTLSLPCTILIICRQNRRSMIRGRVV